MARVTRVWWDCIRTMGTWSVSHHHHHDVNPGHGLSLSAPDLRVWTGSDDWHQKAATGSWAEGLNDSSSLLSEMLRIPSIMSAMPPPLCLTERCVMITITLALISSPARVISLWSIRGARDLNNTGLLLIVSFSFFFNFSLYWQARVQVPSPKSKPKVK